MKRVAQRGIFRRGWSLADSLMEGRPAGPTLPDKRYARPGPVGPPTWAEGPARGPSRNHCHETPQYGCFPKTLPPLAF